MQRRFFGAWLLVFLFVGTAAWGQYQPNPTGQQPQQQQSNQQAPLQTPPKSITLNGTAVQPNESLGQRTQTPGFGSPYPTGNQAVATQPGGGYYGAQPVQRENVNPMYVAQANPAVAGQPVAQPQVRPELQPNLGDQAKPVFLEGALPPELRRHVGRSEPDSRIVPFLLTAEEQVELDEFLVRWEKFGNGIKRLDVDFTAYEKDPTFDPTSTKPVYTAYGEFKYVAPNRFVYHVKGQWIDGKQVEGGPLEEKTIIDGASIFEYVFKTKKVKQYKIAPELLERGFADSPLPLIFGAKADEMKRRFSMKIVTSPEYRESQIWLQAKPLLIADQQEFLELELRIDKKTLRPAALKKDNINGKAHTVYVLTNLRVNSLLDMMVLTPTTPIGWTREVVEPMPMKPADSAPQIANPYVPGTPNFNPNGQPTPNPGPSTPNPNEIKLY